MPTTTDRAGDTTPGPYDILNAPQVAVILGVSPSRVADYIAHQGLQATNIGSAKKPRWAFLRCDVEAWDAAHPRPGRGRWRT